MFTMFTNLTHLRFNLTDICWYLPQGLITLPSTKCYSSNIVHLNVVVHLFYDCLCLLDGRLSQLRTFIVRICWILEKPMIIDNTVKCFK